MEKLVGRQSEIAILEEAFQSNEAEMVAVIGRRRVGKTFLIKTVYNPNIVFSITGVQNAKMEEQLSNFTYQLNEYGNTSLETPSNWLEAFQMLITFLKTKKNNQKKPVVFFDELPWLASMHSGFLRGLSFFWNSWAVDQNIIVVVCGSAASWMINKIVNHRGGLHNRITKRIFLAPFDLTETELYLKSRKINFDRYQIVQLYMAMGGIPHYLKEIKAGKSATQNINAICFSKNGLLRNEFSNLYPALFSNAENHIAVIRALAKKRVGLTRKSIVELSKVPEGGAIQRVLEELEQSGFIEIYPAFGKKKKERLYRLIDEYSLFYLQFIDAQIFQDAEIWDKLSQTSSYKAWSGYAFESICLKHISSIKKSLGISGIYSQATSFYKKGNDDEKGIQIDLVIDRNDHVINLFEVKFYNTPFLITKDYANNLRQKVGLFKVFSKTNKQIFISMITTFGLIENKHSLGLVHNNLTIDDLFE
jgi:AAA+ ATPase superfamily predicted ATPase